MPAVHRKRSDPFFTDADGVLHWLVDGQKGTFQWTGTDTFTGANILSIGTPQGVRPHDDLMAVFPFLGMPNP
jgi:hypothetical protein